MGLAGERAGRSWWVRFPGKTPGGYIGLVDNWNCINSMSCEKEVVPVQGGRVLVSRTIFEPLRTHTSTFPLRPGSSSLTLLISAHPLVAADTLACCACTPPCVLLGASSMNLAQDLGVLSAVVLWFLFNQTIHLFFSVFKKKIPLFPKYS